MPAAPRFVRHPAPATWAALHAGAPQATVYTAGWWLDAVTGGEWGAVVVPDGAGGYAAGLPVPLRRAWRRLGRLEAYQPFFTQQLGVLTAAGSPPETDAAPFLAALPPGLPAYGQLHVSNRATALPGFRLGERVTYHLDLAAPYPALTAAFQQNHRRNLKKAAGLVVAEEPAATEAIIQLFRQTKGRDLPEVKPRHYALLTRLAAGLLERHQLVVLTARQPGTGALLAGGLFAHDARQLIYLLGSTTDAGRQQGAMHAVVDALIRREAGTTRRLDFEGSMVESVARFYAGFGGRPVPYLTFERM